MLNVIRLRKMHKRKLQRIKRHVETRAMECRVVVVTANETMPGSLIHVELERLGRTSRIMEFLDINSCNDNNFVAGNMAG